MNHNSTQKGSAYASPTLPGPQTAGFTLIEVLIAFLVLAIGLVGISSLHLTSLSSAHSSYLRSVSSSIALDLEEQLWMELAETAEDECPSANSAITRTRTVWSGADSTWTEAKFATLPGIEREDSIEFDEEESGVTTAEGTPYWTTVRFTLRWSEERFEEEDEGESFSFETWIPCNPALPS